MRKILIMVCLTISICLPLEACIGIIHYRGESTAEMVWDADVVVLIKGVVSENEVVVVEVLKGTNIPEVLPLGTLIEIGFQDSPQPLGTPFINHYSPWGCMNITMELNPEHYYLMFLDFPSPGENDFRFYQDYHQQAAVAVTVDHSWLEAVRLYVKAEVKGNFQSSEAEIKTWLEEEEVGERKLPRGMLEDLREHFEFPSRFKQPEMLLSFLSHSDPEVRENTLYALSTGGYFEYASEVMDLLEGETNYSVLEVLATYAGESCPSGAVPFFFANIRKNLNQERAAGEENTWGLIQCAGPEEEDRIFQLMRFDDGLWSDLMPWFQGRDFGPLRTLLLTRVDKGYLADEEAALALASMGDPPVLAWAQEKMKGISPLSKKLTKHEQLVGSILAVSPSPLAVNLVMELVEKDHALLAPITEALIASKKETRFALLMDVIEQTKQESILEDLYQFNFPPPFFASDPRWKELQEAAGEALEYLREQEDEQTQGTPPASDPSHQEGS